MRLRMDGSRGGSCMTGPRDMKPWEIRVYRRYRNNLHTIKPTTKQGRNIHRLELALIVWPAHLYARWVQHKSRYETNTTVEDVK